MLEANEVTETLASTETLGYRHVPLRPSRKLQAGSLSSRNNAVLVESPRRIRLRPDYEIVAYDLLMVWDLLSVLVAGYGCVLGRWLTDPAPYLSPSLALWQGPLPLVGALLAPLILRQNRERRMHWQPLLGKLTFRVAILFGLLLAIGVLTGTLDHNSQPVLAIWAMATFGAAISGRLLLAAHIRDLKRRGVLRERVAIVGAGSLAERLLQALSQESGPGSECAGVFDDRPPLYRSAHMPIAGSISDLVELGKRWPLDRVILALPKLSARQLLRLLGQLKALDAEIAVCPQRVDLVLPCLGIERVGDLQLLKLAPRAICGWGVVLKALEDKVLGALLLLLALPIMGLCALAVRLEGSGPIIFRQSRHGWNNSVFQVFKFRTMIWLDEASAGRMTQTTRGDPRITRVGSFLRKTSLDELPQLFNVLRGEMSLVGPRPHAVTMRTQDRLCSEILAEYAHRHRVKPGITGLAQVNGCRGATEEFEQIRRRVAYDLSYVENWSLLLDLKILALTPLRLVLHSENAF